MCSGFLTSFSFFKWEIREQKEKRKSPLWTSQDILTQKSQGSGYSELRTALRGYHALALCESCFTPDWLAGSIRLAGAEAPWGFRSQRMIIGELSASTVLLPLLWTIFPSAPHIYTWRQVVLLAPLWCFDARYPQPALQEVVLEDSQGPPFLKSLSFYTDGFTTSVTLFLCSPLPSAHQAASPAAGCGTSIPLCRNMQGWVAGWLWPSSPTYFPRLSAPRCCILSQAVTACAFTAAANSGNRCHLVL